MTKCTLDTYFCSFAQILPYVFSTYSVLKIYLVRGSFRNSLPFTSALTRTNVAHLSCCLLLLVYQLLKNINFCVYGTKWSGISEGTSQQINFQDRVHDVGRMGFFPCQNCLKHFRRGEGELVNFMYVTATFSDMKRVV